MRRCGDLEAKGINRSLGGLVGATESCLSSLVYLCVREGGRVHPHVQLLGIDVMLLTICTPPVHLLPANKRTK